MLGAEKRFGKGLGHATETAWRKRPRTGRCCCHVSISKAPQKGELAGGHVWVGHPHCSEMSIWQGRQQLGWICQIPNLTAGVLMSPKMIMRCFLPGTQRTRLAGPCMPSLSSCCDDKQPKMSKPRGTGCHFYSEVPSNVGAR